jgi:hypothetical protein
MVGRLTDVFRVLGYVHRLGEICSTYGLEFREIPSSFEKREEVVKVHDTAFWPLPLDGGTSMITLLDYETYKPGARFFCSVQMDLDRFKRDPHLMFCLQLGRDRHDIFESNRWPNQLGAEMVIAYMNTWDHPEYKWRPLPPEFKSGSGKWLGRRFCERNAPEFAEIAHVTHENAAIELPKFNKPLTEERVFQIAETMIKFVATEKRAKVLVA